MKELYFPVYLRNPHVDAWNFKPRHADKLLRALPQLRLCVCESSKQFAGELARADGVITWLFKKEWLAHAPRLRLIATPAAGNEWIEADPAAAAPRLVFGGFHGAMIAESVLGAIFYFTKAFRLSADLQARRSWDRALVARHIASLYGARVTILGFGKIGQALGRALKPFGCQITGVKRAATPAPDYFTAGDRILPAPEMAAALAETSHLLLALPGGPETDGMFTRAHFDLLPRGCYLYNVGRGNIWSEADLDAALREGRVAGAYLDVFTAEPLPETSPLWTCPNTLIQPHISAASPQYLDLYIEELIGQLKTGCRGIFADAGL